MKNEEALPRNQGDVTFREFNGTLPNAKIAHSGSFVLALGETTGHKHVITVEKPEQMEVRRLASGQHVIVLTAPGTVTHEEHEKIIVPPGTYRVGGERERDHFANMTRQVID